jgi:lysophospholipase L1-like esterase
VPLDPTLLAKCTGTNPIKCDLPFANGNYKVTVELGSATASATTRVLAETRRIVLQPTTTAAGAYTRFTFAVNVRAEQHDGYSAPGGILNLTFDGASPAVHGVGVAAANIPTLYIASDSTVCDWDPAAYTPAAFAGFTDFSGWGQEVSQYFNAGLAVANYADSGETSQTFYSKFYPPVKAAMKQGDFLIVEFGHNDMKSLTAAQFTTNLTKYLTDAAAKSVTPILITPVSRESGANFVSQVETGGIGLDQAMRNLAKAQQVALVDLTQLSVAYLGTLSSSAKSALYIDGTHFHEAGATQIANLVAQALKSGTTGLEKYIR